MEKIQPLTHPPVPLQVHLTQKMAAGVLVVDPAGIIVAANEHAATMLGTTRVELIGQAYDGYWPHELPRDPGGGTEIQLVETELHGADGRTLSVDLTITPAADYLPHCLLLSFTDCCRVTAVNEALTRIQRLAGIGILTASVAHELNTPVSVIAATCSNLQHEIAADTLTAEQLAYYARLIDQSAWRAARTLEVLRNYSYDEDIHPAVTDLNLIVEDALTLVRQQFQSEFNIQIEMDLSPLLKSIICDHNRMTQVLINLLANARDSMLPQGGTIRVRTWVLAEGESGKSKNGSGVDGHADLTQNDLNSFAAKWPPGLRHGISISDTGAGITPQLMEKIFDPFFSTKSAGRGAGLGLYIAQQIVAQHNGRLLAENNSNGGATFTVLLPRKP